MEGDLQQGSANNQDIPVRDQYYHPLYYNSVGWGEKEIKPDSIFGLFKLHGIVDPAAAIARINAGFGELSDRELELDVEGLEGVNQIHLLYEGDVINPPLHRKIVLLIPKGEAERIISLEENPETGLFIYTTTVVQDP